MRAIAQMIARRIKAALNAEMLRLYRAAGVDCASALRMGCFSGFHMAYREGTADEAVLRQSFADDIFFSGVPEYEPRETDVIVDVGAHIGSFAVLAASKAPRGKVYAIEACEETFHFLRINAALNRVENLSAHHLALADRRGTCALYHDSGNWGHSVVRRMSPRSETVECCTLPQFLDATGVDRCDFIKFNCEGAEFPILLSSPAAVLQRIGTMLVLYHCDLWTANSKDDLVGHLEACGFECRLRNCTEDRGWIVAMNRAG